MQCTDAPTFPYFFPSSLSSFLSLPVSSCLFFFNSPSLPVRAIRERDSHYRAAVLRSREDMGRTSPGAARQAPVTAPPGTGQGDRAALGRRRRNGRTHRPPPSTESQVSRIVAATLERIYHRPAARPAPSRQTCRNPKTGTPIRRALKSRCTRTFCHKRRGDVPTAMKDFPRRHRRFDIRNARAAPINQVPSSRSGHARNECALDTHSP